MNLALDPTGKCRRNEGSTRTQRSTPSKIRNETCRVPEPFHQDVTVPLTMEALACRDGLEAARDRGVTCLQLETDCQELSNMLLRGDYQRSFLAPILSEIKELSLHFSEFILLYVNRSCNRVAHLLAKQVTSVIRLGEWHVGPTCIDHLLTEECNLVPPG